eukprot:4599751-Pyramimonas_sp.AAC.1
MAFSYALMICLASQLSDAQMERQVSAEWPMTVDGSPTVFWGCLSSRRGALGPATMRRSLPGESFHACFAQS